MILEALASIFLAAHLWCMNLSSAAPLYGILLDCLSRRHNSRTLQRHARRQGTQGLAMLVVGILTGLAVAGLMWLAGDRGLFNILPQFSYKIKWAVWELVFYALCMVAYVALFAESVHHRPWTRVLRAALAILASTNILYHFPPLFAIMVQAADQPDIVSDSVGPQEFRGLLVQGHIMAITVHFALASLAVGGVAVMCRLAREAEAVDADEAKPVSFGARCAAMVALAVTACQLIVGVWVLVSLNAVAQTRLLGGDIVATATFGASVVLTFWVLHTLANASFSFVTRAGARSLMIGLIIIVLLMTVTLRRAQAGSRPLDVFALQRRQSVGFSSANDSPLSFTSRRTLSCPPKAIVCP